MVGNRIDELIDGYGGEADLAELPSPIRPEVMDALQHNLRHLEATIPCRAVFVKSTAAIATTYRQGGTGLVIVSLGMLARMEAFLRLVLQYNGRRFLGEFPRSPATSEKPFETGMPRCLRPLLGHYENDDEFWAEIAAIHDRVSLPPELAHVGLSEMVAFVGYFVLSHESIHICHHHHCFLANQKRQGKSGTVQTELLELIADIGGARIFALGLADSLRKHPKEAKRVFTNAGYAIPAFLALNDCQRSVLADGGDLGIFHAHALLRGSLFVEAVEQALAETEFAKQWVACAEVTWDAFNQNMACLLENWICDSELTFSDVSRLRSLSGAFESLDEIFVARGSVKAEAESKAAMAIQLRKNYAAFVENHSCEHP